MSETTETIFSKIIRREIPAEIVYEDDLAIAFKDVFPQAPVHILVIPKEPIAQLADAESKDHALMGHLLLTVKRVAQQAGLNNGYRVVINTGPDGGQTAIAKQADRRKREKTRNATELLHTDAT